MIQAIFCSAWSKFYMTEIVTFPHQDFSLPWHFPSMTFAYQDFFVHHPSTTFWLAVWNDAQTIIKGTLFHNMYHTSIHWIIINNLGHFSLNGGKLSNKAGQVEVVVFSLLKNVIYFSQWWNHLLLCHRQIRLVWGDLWNRVECEN